LLELLGIEKIIKKMLKPFLRILKRRNAYTINNCDTPTGEDAKNEIGTLLAKLHQLEKLIDEDQPVQTNTKLKYKEGM
jgi:hypothetical protein